MKTTILFLAAAMIAVAAPIAIADETAPDCEANQPWIGYTSTSDVQATYESLGSPGGLYVCEGEHWDGQDTVGSQETSTSNCAAAPQVSASGVAWCMGSDPNEGDSDPTAGATPVALRVSAGDGAYVGSSIFSVGRAVVYTDGSNTVAVYIRDNTPGELLAQVVSAPRITQGHVDPNDCSQAEYQAGAEAHDGTKCGRDNTAITLTILS